MPVYRYVGPGFIPGIPARDLTPDEAREYLDKGVDLSHLYVWGWTEDDLSHPFRIYEEADEEEDSQNKQKEETIELGASNLSVEDVKEE